MADEEKTDETIEETPVEEPAAEVDDGDLVAEGDQVA